MLNCTVKGIKGVIFFTETCTIYDFISILDILDKQTMFRKTIDDFCFADFLKYLSNKDGKLNIICPTCNYLVLTCCKIR